MKDKHARAQAQTAIIIADELRKMIGTLSAAVQRLNEELGAVSYEQDALGALLRDVGNRLTTSPPFPEHPIGNPNVDPNPRVVVQP